ncbi:MAG TPA: multicopper oxidase family protein [Candidatus Tumulicola sp.]|jgi:FtsP/CotA-like multicopper oxidase with cupredoxin domain
MRRFFSVAVLGVMLASCGGGSGAPNVQNAPGGLVPPVISGAIADGKPSNPLPEPPEVLPVHHVAALALTAQINPATSLPELVYQGNNAGLPPTIRVKPGDTIVMDVADNLPNFPRVDSSMQADMNIHFHGLTVSPNPPADNVTTMLASPGGSLHYVVPIPKDQEPGLYWYHPHVYQTTDYHVGQSGISGAIVVDGLEHHLPGLAKMTERLIVIRATGLRRDTRARPLPHKPNGGSCSPDPGLTVTTNGAVKPTIDIAPGEKQFFRVVNATGHKTLKLAVDGGTLDLVAIDGFALDTYPGTGPTEKVPYVVVPPSARAEFVVTGPASRNAKFRTLCYDSGPNGDPDPNVILADLTAPKGDLHPPVVRNERLGVGTPLPQNAYSSPLPKPTLTRQVVLSEDADGMYINGKHFNSSDPPMFVARAGTVEKWQVINVTGEIHDFHIHQIHFVVTKNDDVPLAHPYWGDAVVVPPEKHGVPGSLTLLLDFRDPVIKGMFMFHCHILDHEDAGMMAMIKVI